MARPAARPSARRAVENEAYNDRRARAGITQVNVMVPIERIPELKAIAMEWRKRAKLQLNSDLPSADQILQIHGLARSLRLRLPLRAFATRTTAAEWLILHRPLAGSRPVLKPRLCSTE